MANVESGLRRVTLVVSLGVFLVALGLAGNEIHQIMNYRERMRLVHISQQHADECAQLERRARAIQQKPADLDPSLYRDCELEKALFGGVVRQPQPLAPEWWGWNLGLIGAIGLVVCAAVGSIPWGIFYLTRWIVRGFGQ